MMRHEPVTFMSWYFSFSRIFVSMSRFLKLRTTLAPFIAAANS